jgi:hypothetical protein
MLSQEPENNGITYAPWAIGSDKTTVSVGTGNNQYYPLYASSLLLHHGIRRSNPNAVVLLALLPIPHGMCHYLILMI